MSRGGFARAFQHAAAFSRRPPAAFLLLALACSGPTDIVGVVGDIGPGAADEAASDATDATPAVDPSATPDDETSGTDDVALLLAGQPMTDWPGEALEWPLSVPLAELFASEPANDGRDRLMPAPWPSRRVASGARSSARGVSGVDGRSPELDARLLILDEDDARRLLALMTPAGGPGDERAGVFRDELGDVYRVSVEDDERSLDPAGCDRMRRESFECAGNGPFD